MNTTVSIAMTTYNGENYIIEQLESIRLQTVPPDEVIIVDDKSTDNTVSLIKEYIHIYNLKNWKLKINNVNLGWIANFHRVIEMTGGDIVFFSDQDDIWHPEKINEMVKILNKHQDINVLSCRMDYIDNVGEKINVSYNALPFGINKKKKILYRNIVNKKFAYTIMPGCTMCVRKSFINKLYLIQETRKLPHDALFWKMGTLLECAYIYNKVLISYRIHDTNASSPETTISYDIKSKMIRLNQANSLKEQIQLVCNLAEKICIKSKYYKQLKQINNFCNARIQYLMKENYIRIFCYLKYYNSLKMFVGDLFAKYKK